jgi:formylglycine-generating enzyme required for sulfatase activity
VLVLHERIESEVARAPEERVMRLSKVHLYMTDPDRPDSEDPWGDSPGTTVRVLNDGWSFVQLAEELWRLVDVERAERLAAWQRRAYAQNRRLGADDLRDLRELLDGLMEAIVGPVVSVKGWTLAPEQVPELRARAPAIFDMDRPISDEVHAVAEALHVADGLRVFVERAIAAKYEIIAAFDGERPRVSYGDDWIRIAGGDYVVGLTGADALSLASASAAAMRRRVDEDPDTGLREWAELERTTGNVEYLVKLLTRALPARTLTIAPFLIRRTPVCNGEWVEFMRAIGAARPEGWAMGADEPNRPVIGVSWDDATRFAAWAGGAALPDEEQWERAARGPERALFPWGNDWGDRGAWLDRQPFYDPWPVNEHIELASREGVLGLVTRRWEWTASAFDGHGADRGALAELYPGHKHGGRVRRGGWGTCLVACAAARMGSEPSVQADGTGFRLVRRTRSSSAG